MYINKEKNYTAFYDEKDNIKIKMFEGRIYEITDKETALQLAQSILSAVDIAWPGGKENEFTIDAVSYVAVETKGLCNECCFYVDEQCYNDSEINCLSSLRKDNRDVIFKIKE